jgi:hypothetical protein
VSTLEVTLSDETLERLAEKIAAKTQRTIRREPYTIEQAAKALGVCGATIRRRVQAGIIPCVPNIGKRLVPASAIEAMLGNQ